MSSLTRFDRDGIELIIDTITGESFASVSGYARMASKAKSTISERFGKMSLESVEIPTGSGTKTVRLVTEDLLTEWLPKDNPEMASQIMKLGVRVFLHKLAGYEVKSTAVKPVVEKEPLFKLKDEAVALRDLQRDMLEPLGVSLSIITAIAIDKAQELNPEIGHVLNPAREIVNSIPTPDRGVTVTDIADMMTEKLGCKVSNQKVNKLLIEKGLQTRQVDKKSKKDPDYIPTEKGKKWAVQTISKGRGTDYTTFFQLRWYPEVVEVLID